MSALPSFWTWIGESWAWVTANTTPLGVVVPVLLAIAGGIGALLKWLWSRRSNPPDPRRDLRRKLPAVPPMFTGRVPDVRRIEKALKGRGAVITALHGMGGIGKTATALYAVQRLVARGRFKDAQLFIDLQGYTPGKVPLTPEEALKELLRGAFVPRDQPLPESCEQLAIEWRARTLGLDMLLVLDNARNEDQVRPLLPNHATCTVLVTSRERFGLPGIATIPLDEMTVADAADLALRLVNAPDHRRLDRRQAEALVKACARLPLAIEVAAGNLIASHTLTPEQLMARISGEQGRFIHLERGERSVRAVLRVSLDALTAETRARWAALGVFEGGFAAEAAAGVWAVDDAGATLDDLEQRSLVIYEEIGSGKERLVRYHLHDLLRAVAIEELARDAAGQHEAQRRHAEYYFAVLQAADGLYRAGHDDVGRGLALLDAELANIRAAQRWAAAAMAEDEHAAELAQDFPNHGCLRLRLAPDEHLAWLETSLAAAERRGDREGQARAAGNLGLIYQTRGDLDRAEEMHQKSLALAEELGSKEEMARQYGNLGLIYQRRGELDRAEEMQKKSLALAEKLGHREGMAMQYGNLGLTYGQRGDLDRAEEMYRKGLAIEMELGRKEGMAANYGNLGLIYRQRGDLDRAEEMYRRSLDNSEAIGHKELNANQYGNLGSLYEQRGDMRQAVAYWRKALALFREIGVRPQIEQTERLLREAGVDPNRDEAAA